MGRAQIIRVLTTSAVEVSISAAERSPGLHGIERIGLIGVDAPDAGQCGEAEARRYLLPYQPQRASRRQQSGHAHTTPSRCAVGVQPGRCAESSSVRPHTPQVRFAGLTP
jgi:hypothetical protein